MRGAVRHNGPITRGHRRGSYTWVTGLHHLPSKSPLESGPFEIGGCQWKLSLACSRRNIHCPEMVRASLFSCCPYRLSANIEMSVLPQRAVRVSRYPASRKAALPFCSVDEYVLPLEDLKDASRHCQNADELHVTVDLKNVERVTDSELQHRLGEQMRNIRIEVIKAESIKRFLDQDRPLFGIVSSEKEETSSVYGCSSVQLWASQALDHRYWLCERCGDGGLVVKGCLNSFGVLKRFEDICDNGDEGLSSVTVFLETKESDTLFQPLCDDSILIFAKIYDPRYKDLSYLGHRIAQKSTKCYELLEPIAREMAGFRDEVSFNAYLERAQSLVTIRNDQHTLEEYGVRSGSVIIIEKEMPGGGLSHGQIFQEIFTVESETSRCSGLDARSDVQFESSESRSRQFSTDWSSCAHHFEADPSPRSSSQGRDFDPPDPPRETSRRNWLSQLVRSKAFVTSRKVGIVAIIGASLIRLRRCDQWPLRLRSSSPAHKDLEKILETLKWKG